MSETLVKKRGRRIEAQAEWLRLAEHYRQLRAIITPEAILVAWFLLGDKMWVTEDKNGK